LVFPQGIIMFMGIRNLSCLKKQFKLFFLWRIITSPRRRSLNCPREQLKPFFP
jgi:hypothetical protein